MFSSFITHITLWILENTQTSPLPINYEYITCNKRSHTGSVNFAALPWHLLYKKITPKVWQQKKTGRISFHKIERSCFGCGSVTGSPVGKTHQREMHDFLSKRWPEFFVLYTHTLHSKFGSGGKESYVIYKITRRKYRIVLKNIILIQPTIKQFFYNC